MERGVGGELVGGVVEEADVGGDGYEGAFDGPFADRGGLGEEGDDG